MGILINGKYYANDKNVKTRKVPALSNQARNYRLTQEYQKFDRELVQPYLANGQPNPEFIKHYPEEAKQYGFIDE